MELTAAQGRVLGALVEKERTTPQGYPLTENALLAACNQTTSRDPVVSYDVATVRTAVRELRELGMLRTVHRSGERSDKHRHELEAALGLSGPQVSLLAVLLLRGPQTLAELRSRTERLHVFASTDEVEQELAAMADRDEPLVGLEPRQPGRKEARFGQLLAAGGGVAGGASTGVGPAGVGPAGGGPAGVGPAGGASGEVGAVAGRPREPASAVLAAARDGSAVEDSLAATVQALADEVVSLRRDVDALRAELGRITGGQPGAPTGSPPADGGGVGL